MRITLGAIKEILTEYNNSKNRKFVIPKEMPRQIKEYFEAVVNYKGTPEELVIDTYEEFLSECEHEDYEIEDDEFCTGVDIHGDPQYRECRYKVCNICGATCPIIGVEQTGDGDYDEITGDWEPYDE